MKNILITGAASYVGTSFERWIAQWPNDYAAITVGTRNREWETLDFSQYDAVFHVAGIAHQDAKAEMEELYYKVNRDLTIAVAEKAKAEGVRQFVYMSSMIVYGASSKVGESKLVTKDTNPEPINFYGDSKLQAEKGILPLQSDKFKVVILRPPMIYGKGSKGNYPLLSKFAKVSPIFPDIDNQRSMLHIENLCEFVRLMIDNEEAGIFFPQNGEYVKTSEMVRLIGNVNGKKVKLVRMFNPFLVAMKNKLNLVNKVFGNLSYDLALSDYKVDYRVHNLEDSIRQTEE